MTLLVYLGVGAFAGLTAGLFGVGGGLVVVPVLILVFTAQGFDPGVLTQIAVGTSLAVIMITSISSVRAHHQLGNVSWPLVARLAPGIALGVFLGVNTAASLNGSLLQFVFGIFALLICLQMGLGLAPNPGRSLPAQTVSGHAQISLVALVIGYFSALFGIGGGSLTVPFLSWCNVRMQTVVASSAACGLPIAIVGAASNIVVGWGAEGLPDHSSGFVYWPAFFGLAVASALFAKLGAQLAQRLPSLLLKRLFAIYLGLVGLYFVFGNYQAVYA